MLCVVSHNSLFILHLHGGATAVVFFPSQNATDSYLIVLTKVTALFANSTMTFLQKLLRVQTTPASPNKKRHSDIFRKFSDLRLSGVRVGEHDITTERDCDNPGTASEVCAERYQDFTIDQVIYHPQYSPVSMHDDIAIIRLNRDIDFRPKNAKPICLPIGTAARINAKRVCI